MFPGPPSTQTKPTHGVHVSRLLIKIAEEGEHDLPTHLPRIAFACHCSRGIPMSKPKAPKLLAFHKAANMFPLMKGAEFTALVDDIKHHDLQNPITVIRPGGSIPVDEETIVDGRNRYRACLQAKVTPRFVAFEGKAEDIIPYVVSANIRRRHLKTAERRKLIAQLIKMMPEKSDRQIAETVKASPTTVGTVRAEMEKAGDVSKLDTRGDSRGRQQPANKPNGKATVVQQPQPQPQPQPRQSGSRWRRPTLLLLPRLTRRRLQLTTGSRRSCGATRSRPARRPWVRR